MITFTVRIRSSFTLRTDPAGDGVLVGGVRVHSSPRGTQKFLAQTPCTCISAGRVPVRCGAKLYRTAICTQRCVN